MLLSLKFVREIPETLRNNMIRFGENHIEENISKMLDLFEREFDVLEGHIRVTNQSFAYKVNRKMERKRHFSLNR